MWSSGGCVPAGQQPSKLDVRLDIHVKSSQIMGIVTSPPCLVVELCERGSVTDCLRRARSDPAAATELTWHRRLSIALDAAKGMLVSLEWRQRLAACSGWLLDTGSLADLLCPPITLQYLHTRTPPIVHRDLVSSPAAVRGS